MSDTGFWSGSFTYSPVYAPSGLSVSIGTGPDSNGTSWIWQQIDGWDSADVAGQVIQRSADHGGWPASQFLAPRILTVTVMASAQTQALRDVARAQFQQALAVGITPNDLTTLVYNEPIPKTCLVRRSGKVTESKQTLTDVIFTANLVCPDPRKYGAQAKTAITYAASSGGGGGMIVPFVVPFTLDPGTPPGIMTVVNEGNFETRPTLTLQGPLTAPSVVNATYGMAISFSQIALGPADQIVIDTDARACYLNGAYCNADLSSAWWVLQPGPNTLKLAATNYGSGGAYLGCQWSDAWVLPRLPNRPDEEFPWRLSRSLACPCGSRAARTTATAAMTCATAASRR